MINVPQEKPDENVRRRRDRLAGLWAAELLGLMNEAAHDYVHALMRPGDQGGEEGLVHRLARDLHGKATIQDIRAKLAHFLGEAKKQLFHERGGDGDRS